MSGRSSYTPPLSCKLSPGLSQSTAVLCSLLPDPPLQLTAVVMLPTHEKEQEPTRKYRRNTTKSVRDARMKKKEEGKKSKSTDTRYLKKAFMKNVEKANYQVSRIQNFVDEPEDFIIFVKDSIHNTTSQPAAATAGKYICYGEGGIMNAFLNEGILYKREHFYLCKDFTVKAEIIPTIPASIPSEEEPVTRTSFQSK